jgi:predicted TIM-barrel fold metal-dependent hydrolase
MYDLPAIDIVANLYTEEVVALRPDWSQRFFHLKMHQDERVARGVSLDDMLRMMDEAGVERAFLPATKAGPAWDPVSSRIPHSVVVDAVQTHPNRFSGLVGIDPTEGMNGVRELDRLVREYGFIGAHLYPHWFGLPPDHARYYPFYAKCCELDVPVQVQVGHCLVYSEDRPLRSVGRPITLDTVACDFPELKIVGIHIGWPWTEEMISVAWKHKNVYIGSDAYAPRYWPKEFVHFIDSWGQDKVLFGTDFPVIDFRRARSEVEELGLRPEAKRKFLRENALRLYRVRS